MSQNQSGIFNEIVSSAIAIAQSYGIYITNDDEAEHLMESVFNYASNTRRSHAWERNFFKSMKRNGEKGASTSVDESSFGR